MIKIDVLEEVKNVVASLNKIENYGKRLSDDLSHQDLKLSDLYHFIEINKLDTKGCYRMIKELKQVLEERREIKINLAVLKSFDMQKQKLLNHDNRQIMLSAVCKCHKEQVTEDGYNVYTNEELKELIES
ncbi:MAG: hypothetical protein NC483_00595 [Ruminococcus sp.]|nr:hypothetical protein [Ruminococcus sp.]